MHVALDFMGTASIDKLPDGWSGAGEGSPGLLLPFHCTTRRSERHHKTPHLIARDRAPLFALALPSQAGY